MDILNINKLKDTLSEYFKIKFELLKLDLTEHMSKIISQVIAYTMIFFIALFVFAYASIALANYLNTVFQNNYGGHLIVSGCFLLVLLITIYFLKSGKLKAFIESKIIGDTKEISSLQKDD